MLEVGAGCGYAAAVLGALAARVITVEILPRLAKQAQRQPAPHGPRRQRASGDGRWFGRLSRKGRLTTPSRWRRARRRFPPALVEQLNDPGILVIPVGAMEDQELRVLTMRGGQVDYRVSTLCRFVPLRGGEGWQ